MLSQHLAFALLRWVLLCLDTIYLKTFVQADKVIMTKFTYAELTSRRILSPGVEYATLKSEAVEEMKLSASLHQDRWPEVGMTSFLFHQAELHRKALTRISPQAAADQHSTTGLDLNLGELTQHFVNPGGALAASGSFEEEHRSSEEEPGTGSNHDQGDDDS